MQIHGKPWKKFWKRFLPNERMSVFERLDVYRDDVRVSAALNMAIDEALLETATTPAIRFYGWARPSVSFGYFGKFAEAAQAGEGRELVRRWTGGGIVLHGDDLTYSIVVPGTDRYSIRSPHDLYFDVHSVMRAVLVQDGGEAILADSSAQKISDACFANPVRADVLINGEKIAGAAQRRTRQGLLQQGSIQYERLTPDFADKFADALCPFSQSRLVDDGIRQRAEEIAGRKYALRSWLERR
jgi:lipoyl(octanoyl) transferase